MRWFWLLLGFLIAAAPAAASVANLRAGRGDLADWLWLALAAGYTAWTCWHLSHLPARRRPTATLEEREIHPPNRLKQNLRAVLTDEVDAMEDRYRRIHEERDR
ncbi:hypothetical protein [Nonomuraea sp. NPDC049400]|uniref:hypothetical protein n=1 Tax=Nonomuraea sp. NPDC049400 TaxID=3364352 RepID=UPI0037891BC9